MRITIISKQDSFNFEGQVCIAICGQTDRARSIPLSMLIENLDTLWGLFLAEIN